jgi:hypothetical protein
LGAESGNFLSKLFLLGDEGALGVCGTIDSMQHDQDSAQCTYLNSVISRGLDAMLDMLAGCACHCLL